MKFKSLSLFTVFVLAAVNFSCQGDKFMEIEGAESEKLQIHFEKTISLDISGGFPKLQGNPIFFSNQNGSYFYIQTNGGIGTFDLSKGGLPVANLKLEEIEDFRGDRTTGQNSFIPYEKNSFLYFDKKSREISIFEEGKFTKSQKLARISIESPNPLIGVLRFALKTDKIVSALNMLEVYGKPPFEYSNSENTIGIYSENLDEFKSVLPLPKEYLEKKVNAYDLLISMDFDAKEGEYILNFPILDDLIITKDFENYRRLNATPNSKFVSLANRSGINFGEWKKEYYTENSFFTVYYDPFRDLYIRHYREGLSEEDYESLVQNSFKMFDPKNKNFLLFLDKDGQHLYTMDVSEYNHLYIHFGKEGMYILNDIELENEDSLTFSLFTIERN
ncbi:MAG: hypothetical protein HWE09_00425 [Cyclobacteriaceae bacterium]|nr:hypothetical protein [Cyclobacteriaceae bacterium]